MKNMSIYIINMRTTGREYAHIYGPEHNAEEMQPDIIRENALFSISDDDELTEDEKNELADAFVEGALSVAEADERSVTEDEEQFSEDDSFAESVLDRLETERIEAEIKENPAVWGLIKDEQD